MGKSRQNVLGRPRLSIFRRKKASQGPRTATRGKEIQQKLPNDPANKPPYFVSCFDPYENTAFYSAYKVTPEQARDLEKFPRQEFHWRTPGNPCESFRKALVKQTRK